MKKANMIEKLSGALDALEYHTEGMKERELVENVVAELCLEVARRRELEDAHIKRSQAKSVRNVVTVNFDGRVMSKVEATRLALLIEETTQAALRGLDRDHDKPRAQAVEVKLDGVEIQAPVQRIAFNVDSGKVQRQELNEMARRMREEIENMGGVIEDVEEAEREARDAEVAELRETLSHYIMDYDVEPVGSLVELFNQWRGLMMEAMYKEEAARGEAETSLENASGAVAQSVDEGAAWRFKYVETLAELDALGRMLTDKRSELDESEKARRELREDWMKLQEELAEEITNHVATKKAHKEEREVMRFRNQGREDNLEVELNMQKKENRKQAEALRELEEKVMMCEKAIHSWRDTDQRQRKKLEEFKARVFELEGCLKAAKNDVEEQQIALDEAWNVERRLRSEIEELQGSDVVEDYAYDECEAPGSTDPSLSRDDAQLELLLALSSTDFNRSPVAMNEETRRRVMVGFLDAVRCQRSAQLARFIAHIGQADTWKHSPAHHHITMLSKHLAAVEVMSRDLESNREAICKKLADVSNVAMFLLSHYQLGGDHEFADAVVTLTRQMEVNTSSPYVAPEEQARRIREYLTQQRRLTWSSFLF